MTLNEEECKHIMQNIVKFVLTKAGISSTLHIAVRYEPRFIGIIRIFDPFMIQGAGQISFLLKHYCESTPYIPLLQDKSSTLQLEVGIGGNIL